MRLQCPSCPGECTFDIESPDYSVGITGYSAVYNDSDSRHEPDCTFESDGKIEEAEYKASQEYASNPQDWCSEDYD